MTSGAYTARLAAGLGLIDETLALLDIWHEGMDTPSLTRVAVQSGRFPTMSARRIENLVSDGFAIRYLVNGAAPARLLKALTDRLARRELEQVMFLYTCRAHPILADFVRDVYWPAYGAGRNTLDNEEARTFVTRANQAGKTTVPWSESTMKRVAGYLTGCCADFGLLERGQRKERRIQPFRIEARVATLLAYDLHFAGLGDNSILADQDWALFGMDSADALSELRRLSLRGLMIVQTAGTVTRIGWQYKTIDEVTDAVAQG
jgi:glutathione S-transferase